MPRSSLKPCALLLAALPSLAAAQTSCKQMREIAIGFERTIHSEILTEARTLSIHLPEHYAEGDARYLLGVALQRGGDSDRAREAYEQTLAIDPQDASARRRLEELDP